MGLGGDYCGEGVGFLDYLMGCECMTDVFFIFFCVGRLQVVVVWLEFSGRSYVLRTTDAVADLSGHTTQRSLGCGRRR